MWLTPGDLGADGFQLSLGFFVGLLDSFVDNGLRFGMGIAYLSFIIGFHLFRRFPGFGCIVEVRRNLVAAVFQDFEQRFIGELCQNGN